MTTSLTSSHPTERWEVGNDSGRAADLLARLARERGHHLNGNQNHH